MSTTSFIIVFILLFFWILRQLIGISTAIQLLMKDTAVMKKRAAEEKAYLFIKGLY